MSYKDYLPKKYNPNVGLGITSAKIEKVAPLKEEETRIKKYGEGYSADTIKKQAEMTKFQGGDNATTGFLVGAVNDGAISQKEAEDIYKSIPGTTGKLYSEGNLLSAAKYHNTVNDLRVNGVPSWMGDVSEKNYGSYTEEEATKKLAELDSKESLTPQERQDFNYLLTKVPSETVKKYRDSAREKTSEESEKWKNSYSDMPGYITYLKETLEVTYPEAVTFNFTENGNFKATLDEKALRDIYNLEDREIEDIISKGSFIRNDNGVYEASASNKNLENKYQATDYKQAIKDKYKVQDIYEAAKWKENVNPYIEEAKADKDFEEIVSSREKQFKKQGDYFGGQADWKLDVINGHATVNEVTADARKQMKNIGIDVSKYETDGSRIAEMTEEEKNIYRYYAITSPEKDEYGMTKADKYFQALAPTLDKRVTIKHQERMRETAKENPVANYIASPLAKLIDLPSATGEFINQAFQDEYNPYAPGFLVRSGINAGHEEVLKGIKSPIGKFLYNVGLSIEDSALVMPLGGAGAILLGMDAAISTGQDVAFSGGSKAEIISKGLAAGIFEFVFEKMSIERLFSPKAVGSLKDGIITVLKQGGFEASEELATSIANIITDNVVMGGESQFNKLVEQYTLEGLSPSEAQNKAFMEMVGEVGIETLSGFVSGLLFGTAGAGGSYIQAKSMGNAVDSVENTQRVIDYGLKQGEDTSAFKRASKLSGKENVKPAEVGALLQQLVIDKQITQAEAERLATEGLDGVPLSEGEQAYYFAGANGISATDAVARLSDIEVDSDRAIMAWKRGFEARQKSKAAPKAEPVATKYGENLENLIQKGMDAKVAPISRKVLPDETKASKVKVAEKEKTPVAPTETKGVKADSFKGENYAKVADIYKTTANADDFEFAYLQGWNRIPTQQVQGVDVKDTALLRAFTAGINDRIAYNKNKSAFNHRTPGLKMADAVTRTLAERFSDSTREALHTLGKKLGVEIRLVNKGIKGSRDSLYSISKGLIEINVDEIQRRNGKQLKGEDLIRFVMNHEGTHRIRETSPKAYAEMEKLALSKSKTTVEQYMKKWNVSKEEATEEIVADYFGDLIHSKAEVKKLLKENRTVFDAIMEALEWLGNKLGFHNKDITEARELFRQALDEADADVWGEEVRVDETGSYGENEVVLSRSESFSKQVDDVINGKDTVSTHLKISEHTPKLLVDLGLDDRPILITSAHTKTAIGIKVKKMNIHNVDETVFKTLPQLIEKPAIIMESTKKGSIVMFVDAVDKANTPILCTIKINGDGYYNNVEIESNVMTSAYGKDSNPIGFIKKAVNENRLLYWDKKMSQKLFGIPGLQLPSNINNFDSNTIIREIDPIVKKNISDSKYLELAKKPKANEAKLRKLVEEAAKRAGYTIRAYHGSQTPNITVFKTSEDGPLGKGIYFAESKEYASGHATGGQVYDAYLRISTPYEAKYPGGIHQEKLIKDGYDGVHHEGNGFWVVFKPNQIKSADLVTYDKDGKIIPLSERFKPEKEDIRYSRSEDGEAIFPKGEAPRRDIGVPSEVDGKKVMRVARTTAEAEGVNEDYAFRLIDEIRNGEFTYEVSSNKAIAEAAANKVNDNYEEAKAEWDGIVMSGKRVTAQDIALGEALVVEASHRRDPEETLKLNAELAMIATEAGQVIQAIRIMKRLSPEGQLHYLEKVVDRINNQRTATDGRKFIKMTEAENNLAREEKAYKNADEKVKKLEKKVEDTQKAIEDLERELENEGRITELEEQDKALKKELATIKKELAKAKDKDKVKEQIKLLEDDIKENASLLKDALDEKAKLMSERNAIKKELTSIKQSQKATDNTIEKYTSDMVLLENEISELDEKLEKANNFKAELEKELSKLRKERQSIKNKLKNRENTSEKELANIEKIEQQISDLKDKLEVATKALEELTEKRRILNAEKNKLNGKLNRREGALSREGEKTIALTNKIAELLDDLYKTDIELENARAIRKATMSKKERVAELARYVQSKAGKVILPDDLKQKILMAQNEEELKAAMDIATDYIAQNVKATWAEKIRAWRYLAMLGNFRTIFRNFLGNVFMNIPVAAKNIVALPLEAVAIPLNNKIIDAKANIMAKKGIDSADIEAYVERRKAYKTQTLKVFKKRSQDLKNFINESWDTNLKLAMEGGKYDSASMTDEIESKRKIFDIKLLEAWRKVTNKAMEGGDLIFVKFNYKQALSRFMLANNLNPETISELDRAKAEAYAIKEAQEATFRDKSKLAEILNKAKGTSWASELLLGGLFPFTKTPINVMKRSFEYSPLGLFKTASDVVEAVKGTKSTTDVINSLAKTLSGSILVALGFYMAEQGLLRSTGDDEDEEYDYLAGEQDYAIVIGNHRYTIDWASPSAIPLLLGAAFFENVFDKDGGVKTKYFIDENGNLQEATAYMSFVDGLNSLLGVFTPIFEATYLSGFSDAIEVGSQFSSKPGESLLAFGTSALTSFAGQFVPTALGQIARIIDPIDRRNNEYDKTSAIPRYAQKGVSKILNKIPGVRQLSTPYVDAWGEIPDVKEEPMDYFLSAVENIISPGFYSEVADDELTKELWRLQNTEEAEGKNIFPETVSNSYTQSVDGEKVTFMFNPGQKNKRQESESGVYRKLAEEFVDSDNYGELTDSERAKALDYFKAYANAEGIKAVYKDFETGNSTVQKMYAAEEAGIEPMDFALWKIAIDRADKPNKNGNMGTYTNAEKDEALRLLKKEYGVDITNEQAKKLKKNFA